MPSSAPPAPAHRDPFTAQGLHVMVKPIGPICNLDCEYCYYLHKEELYLGNKSWKMSPPTLREYIQQYYDAQPAGVQEVTFAWQGGEPTLLGLEFFRHVVELQQELRPPHVRVVNALQTNGVLLNTDWAQFFREQQFLIGLSIDGPAELHDRYRYDKQGRPTFPAVHRALKQ
ncbi:MAG: radical SAM protein [Planctomycetaceae bacterium]|nr:radical SAM protein [Planctomycetaceae bacterium]